MSGVLEVSPSYPHPPRLCPNPRSAATPTRLGDRNRDGPVPFPCRREGPPLAIFKGSDALIFRGLHLGAGLVGMPQVRPPCLRPHGRIVGHAGVQAVSGIAVWRVQTDRVEGQPRKTTFWRFPARFAVAVRVTHPLLREWQCIVLRRAAGPKTSPGHGNPQHHRPSAPVSLRNHSLAMRRDQLKMPTPNRCPQTEKAA